MPSVRIAITLVAKTGNATRKINQTTKAVKGMSKSTSGLTSRLLTQTATLFGTTIAFSKLFSGIKEAALANERFEKDVAKISQLLLDDQLPILDQWRGDIIRIGKETGKTFKEVKDAFFVAKSAGAGLAEVTGLATKATKAAAASFTDVEQLSKAAAGVVNAFGNEALGASNRTEAFSTVLDKFFAINDKGLLTIPELANSLGQVSAPAALMGIAFDEVGASLAAVTAGGVPLAKATTQLRAFLTALVKQTPKATAEAKKLGINFSKAGVQEAGGLIPFLKDLSSKAELSAEGLFKLGGRVRAFNFLALLTQSQGLNKLDESLENMGLSAGRAEKTFDRMKNTFKLDRARRELESTKILLGGDFQDTLVLFMQTSSVMLKGMVVGWGGLRTVILTVAAVASIPFGIIMAAVGAVIGIIGKLVSLISDDLGGAFDSIAQSLIGGGFDLATGELFDQARDSFRSVGNKAGDLFPDEVDENFRAKKADHEIIGENFSSSGATVNQLSKENQKSANNNRSAMTVSGQLEQKQAIVLKLDKDVLAKVLLTNNYNLASERGLFISDRGEALDTGFTVAGIGGQTGR